MNDLARAQHWKWVRLGEIAKTASGGTPKRTVPAYYGGGIPWVKSGELGDSTVYQTEETISKEGLDASSAKIFPKGTLCIALYGATVGKLGILGLDAATNQAVCGIFLPEFVDTRFAYRFLESKRRALVESGKGGAQSNISQEIIRDLEFPIAPLDEQREIVAEIEKQFTRLAAGVAGLRRVQANLKRYRAAVLKAACEGKLVPTESELARQEGRSYETGAQLLERILTERRRKWSGKGKYKEPAKPDTANLLRLPEGWIWGTLEQVCPVFVDSAHRTPKYGVLGSPAVGPRDVVSGILNITDARLVDDGEFVVQTARHVPETGDIVYSRELSFGWGALIPSGQRLCLSQGMCLFRPHDDVNVRYFLIVLNGPVGRRQAEKAATGSAHPHVNLSDIKNFHVPIPPLIEQKRIVAEVERCLSVVDELEAVVNANLQRATRLRQSILQRAFDGKLLTDERDPRTRTSKDLPIAADSSERYG